jgi:hypothetical protein
VEGNAPSLPLVTKLKPRLDACGALPSDARFHF